MASRSLSSEGAHGRRVLRECDGLVEAVLVVVSAAVSDQLLVDDCVIEHCVCLLRNISFACQEVVEPHYLDTKARRKSARSSPTASTHVSTFYRHFHSLSPLLCGRNRRFQLASSASVGYSSSTVRRNASKRYICLSVRPYVTHVDCMCQNRSTYHQTSCALFWQPH